MNCLFFALSLPKSCLCAQTIVPLHRLYDKQDNVLKLEKGNSYGFRFYGNPRRCSLCG